MSNRCDNEQFSRFGQISLFSYQSFPHESSRDLPQLSYDDASVEECHILAFFLPPEEL